MKTKLTTDPVYPPGQYPFDGDDDCDERNR